MKTSNSSFCLELVFFFKNQSNVTGTYKRLFASYFFFSYLLRYSWGITYLGGRVITKYFQNYRYLFIIISFDALFSLIAIIRNVSHWFLFFSDPTHQRQDTTCKRFVCDTKLVGIGFNASAKVGDWWCKLFFRRVPVKNSFIVLIRHRIESQ